MDDDYTRILMGDKVNCYKDGCKGSLIVSKGECNDKKYNGFVSSQDSLICRCSINCRHTWVILKSNLSKRIVHFELGEV